MKSAVTGKRFLTGERPTGLLHIGHFVGSLATRVRLQNEGCEGFIILADYQVITDRLITAPVEQNIIEIVKDYIAVGIDPTKNVLFVQSHVPELAELTTIFSMLVTLPQLERNPTVKEEINAMGINEKVSLGMFSYPVSQAADILLFKSDFVPVGADQSPHVELAREIAGRFNRTFGNVFKEPHIMLSQVSRLMGLDGDQKMSKSRSNALFLSDSPDIVKTKITKAVTDSSASVVFNPHTHPYIANLLLLYSVVTGREPQDIAKDFEGKGYREFKSALTDAVNTFLAPIQERHAAVSDSDVARIITQGNEYAREVGAATMKEVRAAMQFAYPRIFKGS